VLLKAALPPGIVGARTGAWVGYQPFLLHGAAYGGLVGPVEDAARFLAAHLNVGALDDTRVLAASTARQMREITTSGRSLDVRLGWFHRPGTGTDGPSFVEHLGGGLGVYNTMRLYPSLDLGIVVMANSPSYDLEAIISPMLNADAAHLL